MTSDDLAHLLSESQLYEAIVFFTKEAHFWNELSKGETDSESYIYFCRQYYDYWMRAQDYRALLREKFGDKCTAYPFNGCAHPQFCQDGCKGQPR